MQTIQFNINNRLYEFVNEHVNTRNGFAHRSILLRDYEEIGRAKVNYLNRTWERYSFQTSMRACVSQLLNTMQTEAIESFKERNNVKRMSADMKIQLITIVNNEQGKDLLELRAKL